MATITLRVLDGADRGRVFDRLSPPITIGREEGNSIQLNDDRVSRYHLKIQEDGQQLVLTDLESTNGTRVNGEDVQLRILRHGDLITLGRSVLLFGSRDEIAQRLATIRDLTGPLENAVDSSDLERIRNASSLDFELNWRNDPDLQATLHVLHPPEPPGKLTPGQAAQLSELIEYLHIRVRRLLASAEMQEQPDPGRVLLDQRGWQSLVDIQSQLAGYLASIGNPRDPE
jgi:hypothetical protein